MTQTIDRARLQALLERVRAATPPVPPSPVHVPASALVKEAEELTGTDKYGQIVVYNEQQAEFIRLAAKGESCALIGSAGTGKTTTMHGALTSLAQSGLLPIVQDADGILPQGSPGIVICAYTRRAVANIRRALPKHLQAHCMTIHKLLGFKPEHVAYTTPEGEEKKKRIFAPTYTALSPLPEYIGCIVYEEASMLGLDLKALVDAALAGRKIQEIYLGDIQQLPPVFGPPVLGFEMLRLPTVELTQVYRQALESPIIRLLTQIKEGKPILPASLPRWEVQSKLTIKPWKKRIGQDAATLTLANFFKHSIDKNTYNPQTDAVLLPYNKGCGTLELNRHIANHLARKRGVETWEVLVGFEKHYYSVGDLCLHEKEDCEIVAIHPNPLYYGARTKQPSQYLDYWGALNTPAGVAQQRMLVDDSEAEFDLILAQAALQDTQPEERKTQASHIVTIRYLYKEGEGDTQREKETFDLSKVSELAALHHSYALTVHKAQGSEWRKVFFCLHQSHATMLCRELLYTACSRASEELFVICEPDSFEKGITTQKVRGTTLDEKKDFFRDLQQKNSKLSAQSS